MSSSAYQGLNGSAAVTIHFEPSIAHKIDLLYHVYIKTKLLNYFDAMASIWFIVRNL